MLGNRSDAGRRRRGWSAGDDLGGGTSGTSSPARRGILVAVVHLACCCHGCHGAPAMVTAPVRPGSAPSFTGIASLPDLTLSADRVIDISGNPVRDGNDELASMEGGNADGPPRQRPRCVLHVGPHKTGTTSLQHLIHGAIEEGTLLADGFLWPPHLPGHSSGVKNIANLANELNGPAAAAAAAADPGSALSVFKGWAAERATHPHGGILLSAEAFDRPDSQIGVLAAALRGFRTTVVVGWRPFYSYVLSCHRQQISRCRVGSPCQTPRLSQWLTEREIQKRAARFVPELVARFAAVRRFEELAVLAVDVNGNHAINFWCDIVRAVHTCKAARSTPAPPHVHNQRNRTDINGTCERECIDPGVRDLLLQRSLEFAAQLHALRLGADFARPPPPFNATEIRAGFEAETYCNCVRTAKSP